MVLETQKKNTSIRMDQSLIVYIMELLNDNK